MRAAMISLILASALGVPLAAGDLGTDSQRADGKKLYDKYCAHCHGINGDAVAPATNRVKPAPRDFTSGKYKFRSTPSGKLPTDADIARVIKEGLPYTSMPGWPMFSDQDTQNVIYYLKTFSEDFSNPDKEALPIDLPEPPPITPESVEKGREVFEAQGCAACHGDLGRTDGATAKLMRDDWGDHIRPADMTKRWTFRGGPTRKDIFRTFSTGLNGTPMPSYYDSLEVEDRWHLVNYIYSLGDGDEPNYSNLLVAAYVDDEIDVANGELFDVAASARFPLLGQIVQPGRSFYPGITDVSVQAVYNKKEIAFRVRWNNMSAETAGSNAPDLEVPTWDEENPEAAGADEGGDEGFWGDEAEDDGGDVWGDEVVEEAEDDDFWGEEGDDDAGAGDDGSFSDAMALQFPSDLPGGVRKPYFLMGDPDNSIDLWFVDLARSAVRQYVARGSDEVAAADADEFEVISSYDAGQWTVIFKRSMRSGSNVTFKPDQFVPVAFSVWDGFNRERGKKKAMSAWFHLYIEPSETVSPYGPMIKAAFATLGLELLVIFFIRRRYAGATSTGPASGDALPAGGVARSSN